MIVYTNKHHIPFQIDRSDWYVVSRYSWHVVEGYPTTRIPSGNEHPRQKAIKLHNFLFGQAPEGLEWDHRNNDTLDNRRHNLRAVTRQVNCRNKAGTHGIRKEAGKWRVRIGVNGKPVNIGTFNSLVEALKARHEAEGFYWGNER